MTNDRALDGDEDHASGDSSSSIESDEQTDVIGGADAVDPLRTKARSKAKRAGRTSRTSRTTTKTDGAACIACFEPLVPGTPTRVVIVGGVQPAAAHVDCRPQMF